MYTCAKVSSRFTEAMKEKALKKDAVILGEYGCKGFNTYGLWRLTGGMNKHHPNESEIEETLRFYESLLK